MFAYSDTLYGIKFKCYIAILFVSTDANIMP